MLPGLKTSKLVGGVIPPPRFSHQSVKQCHSFCKCRRFKLLWFLTCVVWGRSAGLFRQCQISCYPKHVRTLPDGRLRLYRSVVKYSPRGSILYKPSLHIFTHIRAIFYRPHYIQINICIAQAGHSSWKSWNRP